MKEGRASRTANLTAATRAAESMKPENERVCYDPFSVEFVSGIFGVIAKSRLLTKIVSWYSERIFPGAASHNIGRARYIDDYLRTCIDDGIEQLVILGAGYDSRAYRFDELKGNVRVFEVDHPSTQKVKIEKVRKIFGNLPDYVIYVPVDFEKERLNERLFASGYDQNLRTLFIWEGVTYYITAEAVDETLDFVAKNSGKDSSIVFDYIFQSVVDGSSEHEIAKKLRRRAEREGDPFRFGIEKNSVEDFLSHRGFYRVNNVTGEFFENNYFTGKNQGRKALRLFGYIHATVKPRE